MNSCAGGEMGTSCKEGRKDERPFAGWVRMADSSFIGVPKASTCMQCAHRSTIDVTVNKTLFWQF